MSINASTGAINVAASSAGNYTITYSVAANGCNPAATNTTAYTITAAVTPTTGFSYAPNTICVNGTNPTLNTITGFTSGGTYSATPTGLSINASTGAINVAASNAGNYTITYSIAAIGCNPAATNTATFTITTAVTPTTGFSYAPNTICVNGTNPTLNTFTGFTSGGIYSATPTGLSINASTGAINVAASNAGNYTITYSVAANGCNPAATNTTAYTITAAVTPTTTFSYTPNTICANGSNPTLNTVTGFTSGGIYSATPTGLSINASTGAINVASSNAGNYTITYSVAANGCNPAATNTTAYTITAAVTPTTTFSYTPNTICANGSNPTLNTVTGFTSGGIYSATPTGLSINASTGAINVASSSAGNYTITYSVAANGCVNAGSSNTSISITAVVPIVTTFNYTSNIICANALNPNINTVAGFTTGGTFTSTPTGLNLNPSTGAVNIALSIPGNYTITYSVVASGCNAASISNTTLTINAITTANTTISYTPNTICSNGPNPNLNTTAGFTVGGIFSATPAGLIINSTTGALNIAASSIGNYTITYATVANGCIAAGSSNTTLSIGNNNVAVTNFNYLPNTVCNNATNPIINTVSGFTTGGTFSATPVGLIINATTGAINVGASTPGVYTINYTIAASGCNNAGNSNTTFTINPIATFNTTFNYSPNNICNNGANPVLNTSNLFTTGGQFTAIPLGLSLNTTTGAVNIASSLPGTYTITYSVAANGCSASSSNTSTITINAVQIPITNFSYSPQTFCNTATNPTLIKAVGFTPNGVFSAVPTGLAINATTGAINIAGSNANNYTITYTINANGCNPASSNIATITISNTSPRVTNFNYLPDTICTNNTSIQLHTNAGFTLGGLFTSSPVGLTINNNTGLINAASSNAGSYTITYTLAADACNTAASSISKLVVQATPSAPILNTPTTILCGPSKVSFFANSNGNITWYNQPNLNNIIAVGNNFDSILQNTTTLYAVATNNTCISAATATTVQILPLPKKPFIGNDTAICSTDKLILNAGLYDAYLWQDGSTNATFTVSTTGIYTVKITNLGSCSNVDTIAINVLDDCQDIYFANSFTPNGDGINETFGPLGNVFLLSKYQLSIYNRYGQLIYHSNNPYQKWDGKKEVQRNGSASYVWYCTYTYKGAKRIKKGNIQVVK